MEEDRRHFCAVQLSLPPRFYMVANRVNYAECRCVFLHCPSTIVVRAPSCSTEVSGVKILLGESLQKIECQNVPAFAAFAAFAGSVASWKNMKG